MKILIDLGSSEIWKRSRYLGLALRPLLEATTLINQIYLNFYNVPPLYRSGVRYQNEDPNQGYEDFAIIPAILARGWGDCDDLAPWRCAELRRQGEKAKIRIQWRKCADGGKLFHIVVRRGPGVVVPPEWRPRSTPDEINVEDPSRILGMK